MRTPEPELLEFLERMEKIKAYTLPTLIIGAFKGKTGCVDSLKGFVEQKFEYCGCGYCIQMIKNKRLVKRLLHLYNSDTTPISNKYRQQILKGLKSATVQSPT